MQQNDVASGLMLVKSAMAGCCGLSQLSQVANLTEVGLQMQD